MIDCARCHTPLPDASRFCSSCGFDVTGGGVDASTQAQIEGLMARLQRIVEGKYELRKMLGKGGMGAVFLAHDTALEREVAIKVLPPDISQDPQVVKRFHQEAKTAAKLDHPNIIPIYRVESEGGLNYFVMKYIAGTSLEEVLERKEQLSFDYIQRVLWEAACALGHAHQRGVVHRDIKPANIMFDHDGRVILTDFGISKAVQAASALTGTGMIIGTPHYMAPEQAKGAAVDGRADQYSLGVVAYRMVTGELPFTGDSVHTILYKHIFEEPQRAKRTDVPEFASAAIARSLAKDPEQRYRSMEEFATALWPEQPVAAPGKAKAPSRARPRVVSSDVPTEMTSAPTTPLPAARVTGKRPPQPVKKSRAGVVIGLVVLAGAGVGGYVVLSGGARRGTAPPSNPAPAPTPNVVQVSPNQLTLQVGERTGLTAAVFDQEGRLMAGARLRWTSSNEGVARVDDQGAVTAAAAGTAMIVARAGAKEATARVEVRALAQTGGGRRQQDRVVTPPPAEQGFVTVNTDPPSTVFIDGREVGGTPVVEFAVTPGRHTIRVERPGYKTKSEVVNVGSGETVRKRWTLEEGTD